MKLLVIATLLASTASFAAGDAVKGKKVYKKCISCHGKDGMGKKSQKAPMLKGQYDWYLVDQINQIKDGTRKNKNTKKMIPFVKRLSPQDIADVSAYIQSM